MEPYFRPGEKITMKTIQVQKKMKELDRKEMKSRSLIANILDMDDEFPPGKANTVHPSHPGYPKTPLSSIFLTRSNPNLPHSFEVVFSNFDIVVHYSALRTRAPPPARCSASST